MPTKDEFPEGWKDRDLTIKDQVNEQFAQTFTQSEGLSPYHTQANADDIMVRGLVLDENNQALAGADVAFWDQWRGKLLYATKTQENGEWFLRVPSDQYYLAFKKDDLYDEVGYIMVIPQTDQVQEFPTVTLNFNPPEFRITPTEKYYIKCLRAFLRDDNPDAYQLDDRKFLYSDDQLVIFSHLALNDVNSFPRKTNYDLHEIPPQWRTLVVLGASIFALISRGLLENQNQLTYNDAGLSLDIKRADHYRSSADAIFVKYSEAKTIVKAHWKVQPHLLMRSAVPFHVRTMAPSQWRLR